MTEPDPPGARCPRSGRWALGRQPRRPLSAVTPAARQAGWSRGRRGDLGRTVGTCEPVALEVSWPSEGFWGHVRARHPGADPARPAHVSQSVKSGRGGAGGRAVRSPHAVVVNTQDPPLSGWFHRHQVADRPLQVRIKDGVVGHTPVALCSLSQSRPRTRSDIWTLDLAKRSATAFRGHGGHHVLLDDGHAVPPDVLLHADAPQCAGIARGYVVEAGQAPRWLPCLSLGLEHTCQAIAARRGAW